MKGGKKDSFELREGRRTLGTRGTQNASRITEGAIPRLKPKIVTEKEEVGKGGAPFRG